MGRPKGSKAPLPKLRSGPDKVFGVRRPLPINKLPLVNDIGSALAYEAEMQRINNNKSEIDCKDATVKVTNSVLEIYRVSSIPTIRKDKVKEKVSDLWRMRKEALEDIARGQTAEGRGRRKKKNGKVKRKYNDIADKLFEIADNKNVPDSEVEFLEAQRKSGREGFIGGIDLVQSAKDNKLKKMELIKKKNKTEKKELEEKRKTKSQSEISEMMLKVWVENSSSEDENENKDHDDIEFKCKVERKEKREKRKKEK